jgi:uncharacterized membrane protein YqgA involved in biofilm formation
LFVGVWMALRTERLVLLVFSIVLGSMAGEVLNLERCLERLAESLRKVSRSHHQRFAEGLTTAFLLFCTGSMTVLGAFEEGRGEYPRLLLAKSLLDGFSSVALAASLGIGVLFSALPLLVYQGGLTLCARYLHAALSASAMNEITAVGGILLIGLGFSILEIKKLSVVNMLPALLVAGILASFLR